jgi:catechol 2,3-dioxygenase-like lactoylglutathione lyase family enzyme
MSVLAFEHLNITTADLERARRFYADVVGLRDGPRPPFSRPGAWMYLGDQAVVHISTGRAPVSRKSDAFDHVAFRAEGLEEVRARLTAHNIHFQEFGVPENNLHQVFFRDPDGTEIELIFGGDDARAAAAAGAAVDATRGRNT